MSDVIVVGGGPVGLSAAMLFAREGHEVTVLEKDPQSPPATAEAAWQEWDRTGVAQFRQVHHLHPKVRHLLDAELPAVRDELVASGGHRFDMLETMPPTVTDRSPREGDEKFQTISARRAVAENAFARVAEDTPGVKIVRGVSVEGPVAERADVPHVTGVRTTDGAEFSGDLVIDAMGRRSKFGEWARALGARAPLEEASDTGFAYYSRHYRSADGSYPEFRAGIATLMSTFAILTVPMDEGTWAIALVCTAGDRPFKAVRDNATWERVVRSIPSIAHWADGEPIIDVTPMAGAMDRYRRFVVDGTPVLTGMIAVGDSWACTNPTAGRGLSLGIGHAIALRDIARASFDDPARMALAFDEVTEQRFTPWYRQQMDRDRQRVAAVNAAIEGREPPQPDPSDPLARMQLAFATASNYDPDVARGFLEMLAVLALPHEIIGRPGMFEKVMAAAEGREFPQPEGPTRAEVVELLAAG